MNQRLAALWRGRLADLSASMLPIAKWCELEGVSRNRVAYWKRKLAGSEAEECAPPRPPASSGSGRFLAVNVVDTTAYPSAPQRRGGLTVRIGNASIEIEAGCDLATLRAVLQALGAGRC